GGHNASSGASSSGNTQSVYYGSQDASKTTIQKQSIKNMQPICTYSTPLISNDKGNANGYYAEEIRSDSRYHNRRKRNKGIETNDEEVDTDRGLAEQAAQMDQIPDKASAYERYNPYAENAWVKSVNEVKSTFGID